MGGADDPFDDFEIEYDLAALRPRFDAVLKDAREKTREFLSRSRWLTKNEATRYEYVSTSYDDGLGPARFRPDGYQFFQLDFVDEALDYARQIPQRFDDMRGVLSFSGPYLWVRFGEARRLLAELWSLDPGHLFLITEGRTAGLVLDNTLDADEQPFREGAYIEMAAWPAA